MQILKFKTIEEAVDPANSIEYGLGSGAGQRWRVGGAHPSVFLGWVGASWPRPPKSLGKKLKIVKKEN
jgi:hypothetical protein